MTVQLTSETTIYRPGAFLRHIAAQCAAVAEEVRTRTAIRRMLGKISDRQLKDAGLIRHDLEAACAHDLSHESALELNAAVRHRAGNW